MTRRIEIRLRSNVLKLLRTRTHEKNYLHRKNKKIETMVEVTSTKKNLKQLTSTVEKWGMEKKTSRNWKKTVPIDWTSPRATRVRMAQLLLNAFVPLLMKMCMTSRASVLRNKMILRDAQVATLQKKTVIESQSNSRVLI